MRTIDSFWRYCGLQPNSSEAGESILKLQYEHVKKNIPRLYLVITVTIITCLYAIIHSSSIVLRIVLPIMVFSIIAGRMIWWIRHRNDAFEPAKALKLLRGMLIVSTTFGVLCALWGVIAWETEAGIIRYYIPVFMAMGAFSIGYCLALTPRAAIVNLLIPILPICTQLLISESAVNFGLAIAMIASALFFIGLIQQQYRNMRRVSSLQIEMQAMAHTDSLTGLSNRRALHDRLENALADAKPDETTCLAMIDLDGFKAVNDTHGHQAGDAVLQIAAERLKTGLEEYATVARLGGDEFAALFEGKTSAFCKESMKTVIRKMQMPAKVDGVQMRVGASYGLASANGADGVDGVTLISQTDALLYGMKSEKAGTARRSGDVEHSIANPRAA